MTDNNNTKDDRNKLSAVWNAAPSEIGLDDKITIIKNWSYKALKYLPPWIMPEAIESDGYYFVAYSRKDFKIVYTDILRLESVGVDIWYDRSMEPGRNWQEIAERMMNRQECKGVIVYGTVNSMASEPVQTELLVADELGKNIIFINRGKASGATAARNLYEEAKKTPGVDCACVERFEELLTRIGSADITYIDLAHSAKRKKEQLDAIKPEEVLIYKKLLSLTIVDGVKYLGVKSVKIPENVTIDGEKYYVTAIEACAFANCRALEKVVLPERLVQIGEHAFFGCESLTKVHLGRDVFVVAENAFEKCEKLEDVTVADDNKRIIVKDGVCYKSQFSSDGCGFVYGILFVPPDLEGDIALLGGLEQINEHAFDMRRGITSVTIPDSVTRIGEGAFEDCTSLASIAIPDGVTSIESYTFEDCTSLTSVTIPDSVTSIGEGAFERCTSLTSVTIPDSVTSIGDCAFERCTSLTSITIPDSVVSIGWRAFRECTSLTSVTIGNGVATIGISAFERCTSLASITIPDSVTSIGGYAFEDCTSLASVAIGNSVATIDAFAFRGCTSLTSVTIPDSVMSMGEDAFYRCGTLRHVTFLGTTEQWKELTNMHIGGWARGCPCETVKCKDGEVPVTEHDRVSIYDLELDIEEPDVDEEE